DALIEQNFVIFLTIQDLFADFRHTARAQRVRRAGPAEWRLRFLVRLQQWLIGPPGREGRALGNTVIDESESVPHSSGGNADTLLQVLDRFMHSARLLILSSGASLSAT